MAPHDRSTGRRQAWFWTCAALVAMQFAVTALAPVRADTYGIDKQHTNVTVSWDHLGLSRQSARVVDVDGRLEFNPAVAADARLEVTMRAASIWTGVSALDRHLRTPDFFDVATHPEITFRSTAVRVTGDRTGEVTGDLTMVGVTRALTLNVTWNFTGEHPLAAINPSYSGTVVSGFSARAKIKRSEWGLTRGVPLASDEIEIAIEAELLKR